MAPPKGRSREVFVVYGHHASLERFYSIAQVLNDDAGVTLPDLPGFGGMDSFYKIGEKPNIDTMADYLASVIKLRYKNQHFSIAAFSYGFAVVTRMLERYPDIAGRVDLLVSIVGFAHHDDIVFSRGRHMFYKVLAHFFSFKLPAAFFQKVILSPFILRTFYKHTHNAKQKFSSVEKEEHDYLTEFEIHLWKVNEVRTYMAATITMLTLDNTKSRIYLPVWHIHVKTDNYFNNESVEKHMRMIFTDYKPILAPIKNHMPNVIAGKEESAMLFPKKVLQLIRSNPK